MLLVAVLVLFGGTFLVVRFTGPDEPVDDEPWLFRLDDGTINRIVVSHNDQRVNYDKNPASLLWFILGDQGLPVNFEKWAGTPLLLSGPRVNRVLADTIDDPVSYGLDPPETIVEVTESGGQGFEFHMGFPTPDEVNTYARLVGFPQLFTVPTSWSDVISRLATEPPFPRLYVIEQNDIRDIQVISDGRTVDYHKDLLTRQFYIEGDTQVPLSPEKWDAALGLISFPQVVEVLSEDVGDVAAYGLDPPRTIARLIRMDGSTIEFHLGKTTPNLDRYYARTVGKEELMLVPASWAEVVIELATDPPYLPEGAAASDSG